MTNEVNPQAENSTLDPSKTSVGEETPKPLDEQDLDHVAGGAADPQMCLIYIQR